MKKRIAKLISIPLAALLMGCAGSAARLDTAPPASETSPVEAPTYPARVIEHKNSAAGEEIPVWFYLDYQDISRLPEFRGTYAFVFARVGPDLDRLVEWTRGFAANAKIAQRVAEEFVAIFEESSLEAKEAVKPYVEDAARVLADAEYAGTQRGDDYWVYQEAEDGQEKELGKHYLYRLLYTVPREQIYSAVEIAFRYAEAQRPPETKEATEALSDLLDFFEGQKQE